MNSNQDRHKKRVQFLEDNRSPQKRLAFLQKHCHTLSDSLVRLRYELASDGWKSDNDEDQYGIARGQKASICRSLRDFTNAAKELDKLHIFELIGIERIVGPRSVTSLSDAISHTPFTDIEDDKLQECVNWILEEEQYEPLALMAVCDEVKPKGWALNEDLSGSITLRLGKGDSIPQLPSLLLAIDNDGTPHVVILTSEGNACTRHCDKINLGKSNPEISETSRPDITDFDSAIIKIDGTSKTIQQETRNSMIKYEIIEIGKDIYAGTISTRARGVIQFEETKPYNFTFKSNIKKADGTEDVLFVLAIINKLLKEKRAIQPHDG